jgi:ABC-type transporter Mla MlaB component
MDDLKWTIDRSNDMTVVTVTGAITEDCDIEKLAQELEGHPKVQLQLAGVQRINSAGVREWVNFIKDLSTKIQVELAECSPPMVDQLNVFANFSGAARVVSIQAPFLCIDCDIESVVVVELAGSPTIPPASPNCDKCGELMEFDNLLDSYFRFLEYHK